MKKVIIIMLLILISACKTTEKCDAYSEQDIYNQHTEERDKYCSVETIK